MKVHKYGVSTLSNALLQNLMLVMLSLLLLGCTGDDGMTDLREFMDDVQAKPKGKIDPLPEFQPYESFSYSGAGFRSPFDKPVEVEIIAIQEGIEIRPDEDRVKEYLEEFNMEILRMVGILKNAQGELWALIKDDVGGVHQVQKGQFMGKNHGEIISVSETSIQIVEIIPAGEDVWIQRPRALVLEGLED